MTGSRVISNTASNSSVLTEHQRVGSSKEEQLRVRTLIPVYKNELLTNDLHGRGVLQWRRPSPLVAPFKPAPLMIGAPSPTTCGLKCCCSPGISCNCIGMTPTHVQPPWMCCEESPMLRLPPGVPLWLPDTKSQPMSNSEFFYPWRVCRCYGCQGGVILNHRHRRHHKEILMLKDEGGEDYMHDLEKKGLEAISVVKTLARESGPSWKSCGQKNGVTILKKHLGKEPLLVKGSVNLGKVSVRAVLAVLEQVDGNRNFDPQFDFGYHLQYFSEDLGIIYQAYKGIMGIPGRDFLCLAAVDRTSDDGYVVATQSIDDDIWRNKIPKYAENRTVRGKIMIGGFCIEKKSDKTVMVTFVTQVNLNANIPAFILNQVAHNQIQSLANLRSVVDSNVEQFSCGFDTYL
eukprot:GHVL01010277.1.p1 GENE.GHVL01010277.1~~GHVL01010277.1.p1  ORF type:complete len:402 (-),score=40.83 GHVL01010277.1:1578-2783(-)